MIHLPFNLPSRSTKSIQPRVFVFHLEYTTASYFTRKNVELNITWALGHDRRLFTEQTVASIIGSITAPLLFWGGGGVCLRRPEMKSRAEGHDGVWRPLRQRGINGSHRMFTPLLHSSVKVSGFREHCEHHSVFSLHIQRSSTSHLCMFSPTHHLFISPRMRQEFVCAHCYDNPHFISTHNALSRQF